LAPCRYKAADALLGAYSDYHFSDGTNLAAVDLRFQQLNLQGCCCTMPEPMDTHWDPKAPTYKR
jgi:hypothetical protein